MCRAGMPKAAVHEDGQPEPRQDEIGSTGKILALEAKPNARRVQGSTESDLGPCVACSLPRHELAHLLRGRRWATSGFTHSEAL
jgi:hypothetical protein